MNNDLFQQARAAYAAKDYEGALAAFTRCLQDGSHPLAPGEMGLLYHQIGNCLVKLKDCNEAIQAYTQATADAAYDACGAVNYNLGMAYAALHDYEDAVKHFEIAVSDAKYDTPYKAYTGMGNALLKLGKSAEAGVAFREAALDEGNPDPTKALLNLGVCFMALDRPADAVASYESALQFDMQPDTKNKLYANLGQAYVACGQMQKAVNAFEQAIASKTYYLSDSASVDYQRAIAAVAQGTSEITQVIPSVAADMSGLDVTADGTAVYAEQDPYAYGEQDPYYYADSYGDQPYPASEGSDRFFNASDEELEKWSKGLAKQDRKRRNVGLKFLVVLILLVLVAFGAAVFLYTQGWGYPSQETVAKELLANPEAAVSTVFAKEVDSERAQTMIDPVVADPNAVVNGVDKSMSNSTVYLTAKTEQGGDIQYKVSLVRDMIGWKVSNIEPYFASQN
ncbi:MULTISPECIES: tetratricopeptide repeat protein [Gordonibacter]|uniref:Tetratricopeptide repeat protein n=1 Tax=Gordonibacter faecis TaxID=3047475 RepID=A0ABT7DNB6_9ACTN|nr:MULTISPECIES: tetratricopeptide repeat protein [unclassified Gordonibacter]MDJ1651023.1 tetratricopeptide repeat protein [Gordonibacter sp. KGMB12511]HIW77278.1 tetratricopeptide repeat protein [Candidatus Gordonibacter avicola]